MFRLSSRSGKKIVVIAVVLLLLAGAVAGAVTFGPRLLHQRAKGAAPGASRQAQKSKAAAVEEEAVVVALGDFLVNLRSQGNLRYLRTEVSISLKGVPTTQKNAAHGEGAKKASVLSEAEVALARDRVVSVLSASAFEQLRTPAGRDTLKQALQASLQQALTKYTISDVLLTSFVMQ